MQLSLRMIGLVALLLPGLDAAARTWTDSSGTHTAEADYLEYKDGKVHLRRADNQKIVQVPIERFSEADQQFIRGLRPDHLPHQIRSGDKVVTRDVAALKVGSKVLATVDAHVELIAAEVQERWIGVHYRQDGQELAGWIAASHLSRPAAGSASDGERSAKAVPAITVSRKVEHADESDFEQQVLKSDVPVLVDFCAEWCGPCQALGPVLEELAGETADARIVKVDVDRNRSLAARYGVQSLPSLLLFHKGQVLDRLVGMTAKARLKSLLRP